MLRVNLRSGTRFARSLNVGDGSSDPLRTGARATRETQRVKEWMITTITTDEGM